MTPSNDPFLNAADALQLQADAILQRLQLHSLVEGMGKLHFTGSYALRLMTWNDIDMQIALKDGLAPSAALMCLLEAFVHQQHFVKAQIINFTDDYKPHWPRGYCLCLKMNFPDLGGVWKLDIWVLEQHDLEKNQGLVQKLKNALTEETRALILQMKNELMKQSGRVPKMGSHWLYQAILFQNLRDKISILDFLKEKGVSVD
ncbi:MAG: hypothetical protein S4CHLAM123_06600 [Chlamydiales bacterium]|nr:hypothetical protein [Chlamydiales bacterium]